MVSNATLNLSDAAALLWGAAAVIPFGGERTWDEETFLQEWVEDRHPGLWLNQHGLYWISAPISIDDLLVLKRPSSLPSNGCDFSLTARATLAALNGHVCQDRGLDVLYNGHRNKVFSRLRSHFKISGTTGALGIREYPLSRLNWTARVIHFGMITEIGGIDTKTKTWLKELISSPVGRVAIETYWRVTHGWPVLSKQ